MVTHQATSNCGAVLRSFTWSIVAICRICQTDLDIFKMFNIQFLWLQIVIFQNKHLPGEIAVRLRVSNWSFYFITNQCD